MHDAFRDFNSAAGAPGGIPILSVCICFRGNMIGPCKPPCKTAGRRSRARHKCHFCAIRALYGEADTCRCAAHGTPSA
jgi:hypothetical protein